MPSDSAAAQKTMNLLDDSSAEWLAVEKMVIGADVAKSDDCKDDINTLLTFAGLYSAVLSAFLLVSYTSLLNKQGVMVDLLHRIATQNYMSTGAYINSTTTLAPQMPFEPPRWAIRVNVLWFTSLILSLAVASIGMLVKQWLREYLALEYASPQQRLRARQYRFQALHRWKVYEIAAALPLLLQISFGLFFLGLCFFTSSVHNSVQDTTIPVVGAWSFFFLMTTIAPLFDPRCPFKTTFLKTIMRAGRRYITRPVWSRAVIISAHIRTIINATLHRGTDHPLRAALRAPTEPNVKVLVEEDEVVTVDLDEADILLSVDSTLKDDAVLPTIFAALQRKNPEAVISFALEIIRRRVGPLPKGNLTSALDLRKLSKQAWLTLVNVISELLDNNIGELRGREHPRWATDAIILLLSQHDLGDAGAQTLRSFISAPKDTGTSAGGGVQDPALPCIASAIIVSVASILTNDSILPTLLHFLQHGSPEDTMQHVSRIVEQRTGCPTLATTPTSVPDLRNLSLQAWTAIVDFVSALLTEKAGRSLPKNKIENWARDAAFLLLSRSHHHLPETGMLALQAFLPAAKMYPELEPEPIFLFGTCHEDATMSLAIDSALSSGEPPSTLSTPTDTASIANNTDATDKIIGIVVRRFQTRLGIHLRAGPPLVPSEQAWTVLISTISNLLIRSCTAPLNDDSPPWAVDATTLLLSCSYYNLPDAGSRALRLYLASEGVALAKKGRMIVENMLTQKMHKQVFPSDRLADRFYQSICIVDGQKFSFSGIMQLYLAFFDAKYSHLHEYFRESQNLSRRSRRTTGNKEAVDRPGVDDSLFRFLLRSLEWCARQGHWMHGQLEALEVMLQFGNGSTGHEEDAVTILKAFCTNSNPSYYSASISLFVSIQPGNRVTSDREEEFVRMVLKLSESEHDALIAGTTALTERYCANVLVESDQLANIGFVRLSYLYLQAYDRIISAGMPGSDSDSDSYLRRTQSLWKGLAKAVAKYHRCKMWEDCTRDVPSWRKNDPYANPLSPSALFSLDRELAHQCKDIIINLQRDAAGEAREVSLQELLDALAVWDNTAGGVEDMTQDAGVDKEKGPEEVWPEEDK